MRHILLVVMVLLVAGCASAPAKFSFDPVARINGEYDAVWAALVEYFAVGNLPIATIEKDSGLIVTGWMDATDHTGIVEDKTLCDCGGAGLSTRPWTRGKFSVFAKKTDSGAVDLRVTCTYQQRRSFGGSLSTATCNSTGYLESQLHEYVAAKVRGTTVPQVPSFKPGESDA